MLANVSIIILNPFNIFKSTSVTFSKLFLTILPNNIGEGTSQIDYGYLFSEVLSTKLPKQSIIEP